MLCKKIIHYVYFDDSTSMKLAKGVLVSETAFRQAIRNEDFHGTQQMKARDYN